MVVDVQWNANGISRLAQAQAQGVILRLSEQSAQTSLAHKLKASAHADRMESESWAQVACLARNTFTRTGDFGTESGMSGCCAKLPRLFGSWICESVCILGLQQQRFLDFDKQCMATTVAQRHNPTQSHYM